MDEVQLNTLYVMTEGAFVHKDGETVLVEKDKQALLRVPVHMLEGVVCFGRVMASPALMGLCAQRGVAVSFMTENGRLMARVDSPGSGSVAVRRAHYRRADDDAFRLELARSIVAGKIQSQRQNLLRSARDSKVEADADRLRRASDLLGSSVDALARGGTLDEVRGREGESTKLYFEHFSLMTPGAAPELVFDGRSRRPPMDAPNALLSFLYGMMTNDCAAAVASVGLDPSVGFLHADRPGRPSLALDLVEEFRAPLADRLAFTLINRKQVGPEDFVTRPGGAVEMTEAARKRVVGAYQERKQERREHPYVEQSAPIGRFPFLQARILARHLRGEMALVSRKLACEWQLWLPKDYAVAFPSEAARIGLLDGVHGVSRLLVGWPWPAMKKVIAHPPPPAPPPGKVWLEYPPYCDESLWFSELASYRPIALGFLGDWFVLSAAWFVLVTVLALGCRLLRRRRTASGEPAASAV